MLKGAYSYNISENTVDPVQIAFGSWSGNPHSSDPNNPGVAYSTPFAASLGHRVFMLASFNRQLFSFGSTGLSVFYEGRNNGNTHYLFASDMNGDGGTANDLIYIPRDVSEMNFSQFTHTNGRRLHGGRAGAGVRDLHSAGQVSERAPRRVCQARSGVPSAGSPTGLQRDAGPVCQHRWQAQRVPAAVRLPELRQSA